jgi:hypothetical protein
MSRMYGCETHSFGWTHELARIWMAAAANEEAAKRKRSSSSVRATECCAASIHSPTRYA